MPPFSNGVRLSHVLVVRVRPGGGARPQTGRRSLHGVRRSRHHHENADSRAVRTGTRLYWEWAARSASVPVDIKMVEPNRRIVAQWPSVTAVGAPRR
ncbi:MAG: hypothetical protein IT337_00320 [Thermomicrobiales bacterium]|nr:hypothetical protein [Thermomicrobiales bacterium]